jgi:hypothetical protein
MADRKLWWHWVILMREWGWHLIHETRYVEARQILSEARAKADGFAYEYEQMWIHYGLSRCCAAEGYSGAADDHRLRAQNLWIALGLNEDDLTRPHSV